MLIEQIHIELQCLASGLIVHHRLAVLEHSPPRLDLPGQHRLLRSVGALRQREGTARHGTLGVKTDELLAHAHQIFPSHRGLGGIDTRLLPQILTIDKIALLHSVPGYRV